MLKRFVVIFLLSLLVSFQLLPGYATAQEPAFTSTAEYEFGQEIRFYLVAEEVTDVTAVTLFLSAPEFPNAMSDSVTFTEADPLAITHVLDLAQVRLAPFTTVTYWWVLTTSDGGQLAVPEQELPYVDDQFAWQTQRSPIVTVNWTGDDPALGQLAVDIMNESLPAVQEFLPQTETTPMRAYIYPTSADLRAALRLTGRDWVGAHAHPELGVILVTAVNPRTAATDLRQSIPHELVHHLLYQITGTQYEALPHWLGEGLATLAESAPNPAYAVVLETAVANQATIPFNQLCHSFPDSEADALLAYAQSHSLIQFIQANYGNRTLQEMVLAVADGADCDAVVSRTLNQSVDELTQSWLRSMQRHSPFWQFWLDNGLIFVLLLAGFGMTLLLVLAPPRR